MNESDKIKDYVKWMLKSRNSICESIRSMSETMLSHADLKDDVIEQLSIGCKPYDSMGSGGQGSSKENLTSIISRYPDLLAREERKNNYDRSLILRQTQELLFLDEAVRSLNEPARGIIVALHYTELKWQEYQLRFKKPPSRTMIFDQKALGINKLVEYYATTPNGKTYALHSWIMDV